VRLCAGYHCFPSFTSAFLFIPSPFLNS
jgi:hypothetical protein